jgi:hypothetical protein
MPSLDLGLLDDPKNMTIAGDGSPYESGSSPYGKKFCQCKEKCDCKRRFSDPEADWGWNSSHNVWFYGYTGYDITAAGSKHDLPIYIGMGQASRHDSVMACAAWTIAGGSTRTSRLQDFWLIPPMTPIPTTSC